MLPYSIDTQQSTPQESHNVVFVRKQKGKALRFATWQITTLTLCCWALTILRHTGTLQQWVQAALNALA